MSRRLLYLVILLVVASILLFVHLPIPPTYAGRTIENAGHTPLFFLVTMGIIFVLRADPRVKGAMLYVLAGAAGAFAGFLSEVIQRPLARDASWDDVYADVIGTIGALALYALFEKRTPFTRLHRAIALVVAMACVTVYVTPVVTMARAYLHRNGQFPVLADFHSRTELYWTMSLGARREIAGDALNVEFVADDFPGVSLHEPMPDWSAYKTLVLDLENPDGEVLHLGVRVHDLSHNRQFIDRFNRRVDIAGGERRTLRIPLEDIRKGPRNRLIDLRQISDITLFRGEKTGSRQLVIHSIRLE